MTATIEQIARQAMQLTPAQRAELADLLVQSLADSPPSPVQKSWAKAANQRLTEIHEGLVTTFSADHVLAEARALLKS